MIFQWCNCGLLVPECRCSQLCPAVFFTLSDSLRVSVLLLVLCTDAGSVEQQQVVLFAAWCWRWELVWDQAGLLWCFWTGCSFKWLSVCVCAPFLFFSFFFFKARCLIPHGAPRCSALLCPASPPSCRRAVVRSSRSLSLSAAVHLRPAGRRALGASAR